VIAFVDRRRRCIPELVGLVHAGTRPRGGSLGSEWLLAPYDYTKGVCMGFAKRFHFFSMATMDTTWSITASGGKLMAFGINYMRKRGNRGSKDARHFVPLIMAHMYSKHAETVILLLETMKY
jgi:hypothetical protein